jgi:prepilin-type N-terminal cleavage/methylation domain-containing protein
MQLRPQQRDSRAGFTLIEMIITASLLVAIAGSVATVCLRADQACRASCLEVAVDTKARRALDRITAELTTVGAGVLVPNPTSQFGTDTLTFQTPTNFVGGAAVWGTQSRIAFEYEAGEINDGVDNNGNGLVDEGRVVFTRNVGAGNEQRVILCDNVREYLQGEPPPNGVDDNGNGVIDEHGFNIRRVGNVLTIRLSLEGRNPGQPAYVRTLETSISLRN